MLRLLCLFLGRSLKFANDLVVGVVGLGVGGLDGLLGLSINVLCQSVLVSKILRRLSMIVLLTLQISNRTRVLHFERRPGVIGIILNALISLLNRRLFLQTSCV